MSVVAVPTNPTWKTKNATRNALLSSKKNEVEPTTPPSLTPNISPNPKSQKSVAAMTKLTRFLIATLIEFFDRTSPLSSAVNPACINSTSAALTSSQATVMDSEADMGVLQMT